MESSAAAPGVAVIVSNAWRRFGAREVLRGVTLDVPRGALVVLAGPNGAGKSSLLHAIGGRLLLDAGTVHIDGRPAVEARRLGRLGVVPQDVALAGHLSVRENLRLWARLAGAPAAGLAARIDAGLETIGLDARAGSLVDHLSGGMRRRVNLLAGVLHRPAALLLDEPTVGVDDDSRVRLWSLLARLRDEGLGVLMATHDLDEAAGVADAVAVLHEGAVLAVDTVAGLMRRVGGTSGEVAVELVTPGAAPAMAAQGFVARTDREWVRPMADGVADLEAIDRQLRAAGFDVREIRFRRPSLQGAVTAVVARASRGRA